MLTVLLYPSSLTMLQKCIILTRDNNTPCLIAHSFHAPNFSYLDQHSLIITVYFKYMPRLTARLINSQRYAIKRVAQYMCLRSWSTKMR